jgi:hypothetical protein
MKKVHYAIGAIPAIALLAPALTAGNPATAPAQKSVRLTGGQARPEFKANGIRLDTTIEQESCAGRSHWFHLAWAKASDTCFGYAGTSYISSGYTSFCGGNNVGWIAGYSKNGDGDYHLYTFGHGTTYAHITHATADSPFRVSAVNISKWAGTDKCPFP